MQVHNLTRSSDDLKLEGYLKKDNIDAGNSESEDESMTRNSFNFREKTTSNNKGFFDDHAFLTCLFDFFFIKKWK